MKRNTITMRVIYQISGFALSLCCGLQCHAQVNPEDATTSMNNESDRIKYETGIDFGHVKDPGVIVIDPGDINTGAPNNPTTATPGQVARESANYSNAAARQAVGNSKFDNTNDQRTVGKPTQEIYTPDEKNVIGDCSKKIPNYEYKTLADEYINQPYNIEARYKELCKRYNSRSDDKEDFLHFKANLKNTISDKITEIHSKYSFLEFTDISELESGKYDFSGAPSGWKKLELINYKDKVKMVKKYGFSIQVFQSTWNPNIFVMSFRTQYEREMTATAEDLGVSISVEGMKIEEVLNELTPKQKAEYAQKKKKIEEKHNYEVFKAEDRIKIAHEMARDDAHLELASIGMTITATLSKNKADKTYSEDSQKLDDDARKQLQKNREAAIKIVQQKEKQKAIDGILKRIDTKLSEYNDNSPKQLFLSYPGRRRTYDSSKGEPISNQYAEKLIQGYKNNNNRNSYIPWKSYNQISPSIQDFGLSKYGCDNVFEFRKHIDNVENIMRSW